MTTSHGTDEKLTNEHKRVLGGALVGTTIEWFDFFILSLIHI